MLAKCVRALHMLQVIVFSTKRLQSLVTQKLLLSIHLLFDFSFWMLNESLSADTVNSQLSQPGILSVTGVKRLFIYHLHPLAFSSPGIVMYKL